MTDEWAGVLEPAERDAVCARIDDWATRQLAEGGALVAVDRQVGGDPVTGAPRWYLRLRGEEKEFVTVWLTLRQRTLRHEAQFMPAPETNIEATWEYLLKRNADLIGLSFALGPRMRSTWWDGSRCRGSTTTSSTGSWLSLIHI